MRTGRRTFFRSWTGSYALNESNRRKLRFMAHQSGIGVRHSVIADYSRPVQEWKFYPPTENLEPFPSLEQRMQWYNKYAAPLSVDAIRRCLAGKVHPQEITHLLTVSCTGMSAPWPGSAGSGVNGTCPGRYSALSLNFMGCYAAIHALKLADALPCGSTCGGKGAGSCVRNSVPFIFSGSLRWTILLPVSSSPTALPRPWL